MYKNSDIASMDIYATKEQIFIDDILFSEHKPLSYYINGGSDPTGRKLEETDAIGYDTNDAMDFTIAVDELCDPRTSMFDVIEQIGSEGFERSKEYIIARKNKPESQTEK